MDPSKILVQMYCYTQLHQYLLDIEGIGCIMQRCTASLYHVDHVSVTELSKIISCMNNTTCSSDPFPLKSYIVIPLIKKPSLDRKALKI